MPLAKNLSLENIKALGIAEKTPHTDERVEVKSVKFLRVASKKIGVAIECVLLVQTMLQKSVLGKVNFLSDRVAQAWAREEQEGQLSVKTHWFHLYGKVRGRALSLFAAQKRDHNPLYL